jgi:acetyl esterase
MSCIYLLMIISSALHSTLHSATESTKLYQLLDPQVASFLQSISQAKTTPIYTLSPSDARRVLREAQKDTDNSLLPVKIRRVTAHKNSKNKVVLEIIRPIKSRGPLPVILYFHGGGWILGDSCTHARLIRHLAYGANAAVVFVNFTPSPEAHYPLPIEQAYGALTYIAHNGTRLNLDPTRIAVAGDSAGGNMATVVALLAKERGGPRVLYQALFYPVTDAGMNTASYNQFQEGLWLTKKAMEWFWNAYAPTKSQRELYTISPLQASTDQLKGMPPTLIITAENDVLRDEGEAYAHKLMQADVPVTALRMLGTIHDFMMLEILKNTAATKNALRLASDKLKEAFEEAVS